jgi:RHS repeat-associated protein
MNIKNHNSRFIARAIHLLLALCLLSGLLPLSPPVRAGGPPDEWTSSGGTRYYGKPADAGDPIAVSSGAYHFTMPLLDLGGPMGLHFSLIYRSDFDQQAPNNPADFPYRFWWSPKYSAMLSDEVGEDVWTVQMANGDTVSFKKRNGEWILVGPTDFGYVDNGSAIRYVLKETTDYLYFMDPIAEQVVIFEKRPAPWWLKAVGRVVRVLDRNGNQLIYTYAADDENNPIRIEDGLGRSLDLTYSNDGLTRVADQAGRQVSFAFDYGADNDGRLTLRSVTDPMSRTTTFAYQTVGFWADNISSVEYPLGNVPYTRTYNTVVMSGTQAVRVTEQRDAYGNITTFTYDQDQNQVATDWPDGSTVVYQHYSHHGLPRSLTDAAGNVITFTKNITEQVTAVTDRMGDTTSFTYHASSGKLASFTDNKGRTTAYTYTPQTQSFTNPINAETVSFTFYNLTRVDHPDGTSEQFAYDTHGNVIAYTDQAGQIWQFIYNERGQPTSVRNPLGGIATYTYNADGTLATFTDSDTGVTTITYDAFKRPTRVTHPDATFMQFTYDLNGRLTSFTDENGHTYTFQYDANGNLIRVTDPNGQSVQYSYDLLDWLTQVTNRSGKTSTFGYDARDRLTTMTDPTGITTRIEYNPRGWPERFTTGDKTWLHGYDDEGTVVSITTPSGRTTIYRTDELGLLTGTVDALGQSTTLVRDAMDQPVAWTDPLSRTISIAYDGRGLPVGVTMPEVGTATYDYNALGLITRITDLNGRQWRFAYTDMGRLRSFTDPSGRTTQATYDARGRVAQVTYPDGTRVRYTYDAAGNLTGARFSGGLELRYTYDALDQLVSTEHLQLTYDAEGRVRKTQDGSTASEATYDDAGRLKTATYNNGAFSVTYTYDPQTGLLNQVQDDLTGTEVHFTYDDDARLTGITRSNGVATTLTWDDADRLVRLRDGNFLDLQYTLDAAGQVQQVQMVAPLDPATYLGAEDTSLSYDGAGQISSTGYAYDQRGRLTAAPGHTYTWDGASRLVGVDGVTLAYNGLGDVVTRTEASLTTHYYYNHAIETMPIVAEQNDTTGDFLRYYVWTPEGNLLYMIDAAHGNAVYFYHFDRTGSTLALTDEQGGVTDAYAYDPYGRLLAHQGANPQPFTFIGRWGVRQEGADGTLYQMRARYYDAQTQRFLSRDPVWPTLLDPLQLNPYQYATGNPLLYQDPTGSLLGTGLAFLAGLAGRSIREGGWKGVNKALGHIKKTADILTKGLWFTGESWLARTLGITGLLTNLMKRAGAVPQAVRFNIIKGGGMAVEPIVQGVKTMLPKSTGKVIKVTEVVSKVGKAAFWVSAAISWYQVGHHFTKTPAEISHEVAQNRKSWDPITRATTWLGDILAEWLYAEADRYYAMTPEEREKYLQEQREIERNIREAVKWGGF